MSLDDLYDPILDALRAEYPDLSSIEQVKLRAKLLAIIKANIPDPAEVKRRYHAAMDGANLSARLSKP